MALNTLLNEIEFLTQYPMVGIVISDTGPIPGYLFGEINAITYVDNGIYCKVLVNILISRLQPDVPLLCIKILKLLLYLVKNGHSQVIEELKYHEVALKNSRYFNGPPDEVYGSSFYETIRSMAKDLLAFIFTDHRESVETIPVQSQSTLTGYGSESSSKKMAGFGHSVKTEKTVSEFVSDSFSNFMEKLFPTTEKDFDSPDTSHLADSLPKYKPLIIEKSRQNSEEPSNISEVIQPPKNVLPGALFMQRKVKAHRPGRAGGGWESSSEEENDEIPLTPVHQPTSKESSISVDSLENSKVDIPQVSETSNVSDEQKVVNEFVINEPLNKMDYSDVAALCKRCISLNCDEVLIHSLNKINDAEENIQLRALVFIEYLLFHDIVNVESVVRIVVPYLKNYLENEENVKSSVEVKSKKICLGIEILNRKYQLKH